MGMTYVDDLIRLEELRQDALDNDNDEEDAAGVYRAFAKKVLGRVRYDRRAEEKRAGTTTNTSSAGFPPAKAAAGKLVRTVSGSSLYWRFDQMPRPANPTFGISTNPKTTSRCCKSGNRKTAITINRTQTSGTLTQYSNRTQT